jgi:hypothetical protein
MSNRNRVAIAITLALAGFLTFQMLLANSERPGGVC